MRCDAGCIHGKNVDGRVAPSPSPAWLVAAFAIAPHTEQTHTDRDADLIVYHTCDLLGWGLWELGQTRVAGKGQHTVSSSRPRWEMFGVGEGCRLISLACFLHVNLCYILIKKMYLCSGRGNNPALVGGQPQRGRVLKGLTFLNAARF